MTNTNTTNTKIARTGIVTINNQIIGQVRKVDFPRTEGGRVWTEQVWEARQPHEMLTVSDFAFPTFTTRREAVDHLMSL